MRPFALRASRTRAHAVRGFFAVAGGSLVGQMLVAVSAPILSRIFTPSEYGVFAVFASVAIPLGAVAAGRFDTAIPIAVREESAVQLAVLGLLSAAVVTLVGVASVPIWGSMLTSAPGLGSLGTWAWSIPVIAGLMGLSLVMNQLAVRQRRYGAAGRRLFTQGAVTVNAQIGAGLLNSGSAGLIAGYAVGQVAGAAAAAAGNGIKNARWRAACARRALVVTLRNHWRYPVFLGPAILMNSASFQVQIFLAGSLYGADAAGQLGMTTRVLAMPVTLLGTAASLVYMGEFTRLVRSGDDHASRRMFLRTSYRLLVPALTIAASVGAIGPVLFETLLGPDWHLSGELARLLSVSLAMQIIVGPLSATLVVLGRPVAQLALDTFRLVCAVGIFVGLHHWQVGFMKTVLTWSVLSAFIYLLVWLVSYWGLGSSALKRQSTRRARNSGFDVATKDVRYDA